MLKGNQIWLELHFNKRKTKYICKDIGDPKETIIILNSYV